MKYKLQPRVNPQDRSKLKYYAAPVMDGRVTAYDLKKEVVALSSLSRGDVSNVVESFIDIIPKYLLMGKSVSLGDLGTFRLSFTSDGVLGEEEFAVSKIKNVRILFTPSTPFRNAIKEVKFEKAGE